MLPKKKVLVTTSDYLPQLGGLTTYTVNLLSSLDEYEVDLFHWKSIYEIKNYCLQKEYSYVFNVHFLAAHYGNWNKELNVNFIHGSEILFYSPSIIKRVYKRMFKKKFLSSLEQSYRNIFISKFTKEKLVSLGFNCDYSRDMILHNCINTKESKYIPLKIEDEICFTMIVRDVPHKNIDGALDMLEKLSDYLKEKNIDKKIRFVVNAKRVTSTKITIDNFDSISDEKREELYQNSHFNILLSLDHSHRGFYEGFGLTCLEAGKYGTPSIVSAFGGLPENVHNFQNGIIYSEKFLTEFIKVIQDYDQMRKWTYDHTVKSHSLKTFSKQLTGLLE